MFSYLRQPGGFYRRLFLLALPIIVQNLITTSLGFLDTFMVGLLGSEQMSAVTVANVPIFIIQLIVFGLQSGSSVLISQYWGRGDRESINRVIGIGLCIAGSVSTLFALIMAFFPADVLLLVTDNLRLVAIGTPYIRIVGFSYILNSLSSIYIGMQRSIENPRFGMLVFGASMLCNTVGNYVLIFGKLGFPALGVTGAAAVIVGKEIGIGSSRESVVRIGKAVCLTAFLFALALGGVELLAFFTLLRPYVLPLFSLSAGAAAMCAVMVYCYAGVMPLHGFSSTMVVGVLRGGGDVRASLLIDNFPLWCVELPLMCLLGLVLKVPNEVFCLCIAIEHLAKTPVGLWRIHSGKWVHDITRSD